MVIVLALLLFIQIPRGFADAVPLIKIHSDNKTLDHKLPKFYSCIEKSVKHSIKEQKDPYFKAEPTQNEVIKCYYDVFVKEDSGKKVDKK
jgi:hypothetical protein